MIGLAPLLLLVVPIAFATLIAALAPKTKVESAASIVTLVSLLAVTIASGAWGSLGVHTRWVLVPIGLVSVALRARRTRGIPTFVASIATFARLAAYAVPCALFLVGALRTVDAWRAPTGAVSLQFPLRLGSYAVGNGGANASLNSHADVRAQSFALDIVKIDGLGFRALGLLPEDLERYRIFGDAVYSPCDGEVIAAVDRYHDQVPPSADREHRAGNHVVVWCDGLSVLLAHLKRGSVSVAVGKRVATTSVVGLVGNSGNTSEPHLHIHAVRGRVTEDRELGTTGDPVAMLFDGRFLVRNDVVTPSR